MSRIHRILFVGFAVGSYSSNASNLHEGRRVLRVHSLYLLLLRFSDPSHENSLEIGG